MARSATENKNKEEISKILSLVCLGSLLKYHLFYSECNEL